MLNLGLTGRRTYQAMNTVIFNEVKIDGSALAAQLYINLLSPTIVNIEKECEHPHALNVLHSFN